MLHNHVLYYIATNLKVNPKKNNYNTERRIVIVIVL